jgi:hypothetical protein
MFTEAETANLDALHANPVDKGRTWQMVTTRPGWGTDRVPYA